MKICRIFLLLLFFFPVMHFHVVAYDYGNPKEKRVIVTYKDRASLEKVTIKGLHKINRKFTKIPAITATLSTTEIDNLKKDPSVISVEEDKKLSIKSQISDWGIDNINAPNAWTNGLTGKGVNIGIIDTGVDKTHSDLTVQGGVSFVDYTSDYNDDNGHGTHVTGIIGARNNDIGVKGVAPDANLYAIKALDSTGEGYVSNIIAGIDWAIANKINIINISAGSAYDSPALKSAVDQAYQNGILVVAASGNEGNTSPVNYPAQYDSVIAVSATDNSDALANFSSTGSKVEVSAPGVNILSTCLNDTYCRESGTSMATPFVSGFLALLKEANPLTSNIELRNILDKSTKDLGIMGRDKFYGFGLIKFPLISAVGNPLSFNASPTDTNVSLSWSPVKDANSYTLVRNGKTIYTGRATFLLDTQVVPSTNYEYILYVNSVYSRSQGTKISAFTIASKPLILSTLTPLYNNNGDVIPIAYVSPQTVYTIEDIGNWHKIHTWIGDKWIHLEDNPMLTFIENTPLYDSPDTAAKIQGNIGPQKVQAIAMNDDWFLIESWLGVKWVKKENVIFGPISNDNVSLRYDEITGLYNAPFSNSKPIDYISAQTVVSFESWNNWYHIHTWLGDKWVSSKHALSGTTTKSPFTIQFDENTKLYQSPFSDSETSASIGPQSLTSLESWNGWYRIHTWIGDKWVSGKHAISGPISKVNMAVKFNIVTSFFQSPFSDSLLCGDIAPQTILVFEQWNNWYHIHTWIGDKWISGDNTTIVTQN